MAKENDMIDLRSDTVTRPVKGMLEAMMTAKVGDDVFGDDPTVIRLENMVAAMFCKEAALFCPSGTMTNQIAIKVHTRPGDEIICDQSSHVYRYEGAGIGFNSGCSVRLLEGDRGRITAAQVEANINPDDPHFPVTKLVVAENTANRGGGSCYDHEDLKKISLACRKHGLAFHLDGARLFNALVKTGNTTEETGILFDSVSICLSKGLGAPIGSVLAGSRDFIKQARRVRKVFGGGMRQTGFLAAAGIYALENHVERLSEDHARASAIGEMLSKLPFVKEVMPVETNIIVFRLIDHINDSDFLDTLKNKGVLAVGFGPQTIRMVTHLDFTDGMMERLERILVGME